MTVLSPAVSVIMPFRNAGKFLDEAVRSVLDQTFSDFEFIIIDDASDDDSGEVIKKYLIDPRVVYVHNESRVGISKNLNKGLSLARAPLVARMDGDDVSMSDRLKTQVAFLRDHPDVSIVGSFAKVMDEGGHEFGSMEFPISPEGINKTFFFHFPFLHAACMFRKDDIEKVGGYRTEYDLIEDIDLFLRLMFSGYLGANLPTYNFLYRKHPHSTDRKFKIKRDLLLRLRRELLGKFHPKNRVAMYFYTYFSYVLDSILSAEQKAALVIGFKKLIT